MPATGTAQAYPAVVFENLKSGLTTRARLEDAVPGLDVSWIAWDSGYRETELAVGDRIVAVDGVVITRPKELPDLQRAIRELPGGLNESDVFQKKGLKDGSPLTLTVRRRKAPGEGWVTLNVTGKVLAERIYQSSQGRRGLGPQGPESLANDHFDGAWSGWYEKRVSEWSQVLDGGWQSSLNSRMALKDHLETKARLDFLIKTYPGAFADTVRADWQAVLESLSGRRYQLAPEALDYREAEERRVAVVAESAKAAWKRYLADHAAETIPAFPSIDPFRGDRTPVIGKLVVLPAMGPKDWVVSIDQNFLSAHEGPYWYFAAQNSPAMRRVYDATLRYGRFVTPNLREVFMLIGRILPEPRMMASGGRTAAGLEVEPVAVWVGDAMFVDLGVVKNGQSAFAGEAELKKIDAGLPAADAPARKVLEAMIAAIKAGDQKTWAALFADWRFVPGEGRPLYYAFYPYAPANLESDWTQSRRLILGDVYDAQVVWIGEPSVVMGPDAFEGAPKIEQVAAEIEHIGLFDKDYRAFKDVRTHRLWTLERRDNGPWRIVSRQSL